MALPRAPIIKVAQPDPFVPEEDAEAPSYRYYVLALLTVAAMFSIADRLVLSILLEDIKAEFAFSDTQLGLLTGFAFTLFYVVVGFPIARLADRSNRKNILAISLAFYSVMTAICGAAVGFWSLFLARMGVGIGEGGAGPPAVSIIPDYFKKHELARALSVQSWGATFGVAFGLMAGGVLASYIGWRMAFVLLGLPGVLLGIVIYVTVREPERGRYSPPAQSKGQAPLLETLAGFMRNTILLRTCIAWALVTTVGYAMAIWLAPIMLRNFEIETANVGLILGTAFLLGGIPGPIIGGVLVDWLRQYDVRWAAWIPALGTLACLPLYYLCLTAPSLALFLACFVIGYLFYMFQNGPSVAIIQTATAPSERAFAYAFAMLTNNVFGQAIGPFAIGVMSDQLAPSYGAQSLNIAVLTVCMGAGGLAVLFYLWAARAIRLAEERFPETAV